MSTCIFKNPTDKQTERVSVGVITFPNKPTLPPVSPVSIRKYHLPNCSSQKAIVLATHPLLHTDNQSLVPVILRLGSLTLKSVHFFAPEITRFSTKPPSLLPRQQLEPLDSFSCFHSRPPTVSGYVLALPCSDSQRASCVCHFPISPLVIHWQLEIDHSGNIYTQKLDYVINWGS